jgi:Periplasmic copper-binding protein (NosD)
MDYGMSDVRGCTVVGGQEGIVTHYAMAMLHGNVVSRTTLRGISMTEMSMGSVAHNAVRDALGVGILCNDHSHCEIEKNFVGRTRVVHGDESRAGVGILVFYDSAGELRGNRVVRSPGGIRSLSNSTIVQK